jgi:hypothetical protein
MCISKYLNVVFLDFFGYLYIGGVLASTIDASEGTGGS